MDIKTTEDASETAFERTVEKWRHHVQAAFYLDGIKAAIEQSGGVLPKGFKIPRLLSRPKSSPRCQPVCRPQGTFEVAQSGNERWTRARSGRARLRPGSFN